MKTIKLTVLFKSGVEKTYLFHDVSDEGIDGMRLNLRKTIGSDRSGSLGEDNVFLTISEIASVEIEVLE